MIEIWTQGYIALAFWVMWFGVLALVSRQILKGKPATLAKVPDASPEYLEAMREVDAMLPGTTPIAPPKEPPPVPPVTSYGPRLVYATFYPTHEVFRLEDGQFMDYSEYAADPKKAQARAHLVHLRSIGVPI